MQVLVPIDNFVIEKKFELGGLDFFPASKFDFSKMVSDAKTLDDLLIEENNDKVYSGMFLRDTKNLITGLTIEDLSNMTIVVTEVDWPEEGYNKNSKEDDHLLILKACEKVDRMFDIIRVKFCRVDVPVLNPGLPGLTPSGFSGIVLINPKDSSNYQIVASRFYGLTMINGLGLELSCEQISGLYSDNNFSILLDTSGSEVSLICKSAIKRLSEAMYIPNIDSKFIYLMTSLETIASPDYLGFSKVKTRILPFIANTKKEYHTMSEELRYFSEEIRTQIIHNGKTLIEIKGEEYNKILHQLQSYIARLVIGVENSCCKTIEELEIYRLRKLKKLGIT